MGVKHTGAVMRTGRVSALIHAKPAVEGTPLLCRLPKAQLLLPNLPKARPLLPNLLTMQPLLPNLRKDLLQPLAQLPSFNP